MLDHVVLLLLLSLLGAVISEDFTCRDVTPFTNFSTAQLHGNWTLTAGCSFRQGQPMDPPTGENKPEWLDARFICSIIFKVNATNDVMELSLPGNGGPGAPIILDAEEQKGYFADRSETSRKLIVLGADPDRYFAFALCGPSEEKIESAFVLARFGGVPENELALIMRQVEQSLPVNSSYYFFSDQSCWELPRHPQLGENSQPISNCGSLTPVNNVSTNDIALDWALVSTVMFAANGDPDLSGPSSLNVCQYWRGSYVTEDGLRISIIQSDLAGNDTQIIQLIDLEDKVGGEFRMRHMGTSRFINWKLTVTHVDRDKFLAVVMCLPGGKVNSLTIFSRYGDHPVISEDELLQVQTSLLNQLNLNLSDVKPVRHNQSCYNHQIQILE